MHFIFKILVLGESEISTIYISEALNEVGESKENYIEMYKEVKVLEDFCDLEINIITNISANFDDLLNTADGIVYILNPMDFEEFELFKMVIPDIFSIKRDIPIVVIFYDNNGILPISVNELLETMWVNYPSIESYVNLSPKQFHQVLQCLCLAMINGESPLNIENAWMRFPIFIQMANIYYDYNNYYYAAQAVKKASTVAEIYDMDEFYILCEQAAFLYSKLNLYLEASRVLEKTDPKKSRNYKKLYAEAMVTDANRLFNKEKYEEAAEMYEKAAQWSSIEFIDKNIIQEAFRLAITSWISACKVQNAFRILESLSHSEVLIILKEIIDKVIAEGDYLLSINNFELAREQLYRSIEKYQREALFEELKKLTKKITEVLIKLLELQVKENELYAAKQTYDEIENMWESYKVEKLVLDSTLEKLIKLFLEESNFGISSILLNKLDSLKLKQKLTELSSKYEDKYKLSKKREITDKIRKGINILNEYVEYELDIIVNINKEIIQEAKELIELNNPIKATQILVDHAKSLKQIGKNSIAHQIFTKALDILLDEKIFEEFFVAYKNLSNEMKKKYLIRIYTTYIHHLEEIINKNTYKQNHPIFENSIRIYRDEALYEESKQISLLFIEVIKNEGIRILEDEENLNGISKVSILIKYISNISDSYLDKPERIKIDLDRIFKKITEIYIKLGDLSLAHTYNDKIENKQYKIELHKKIANLEAERSEIASRKIKEAFKGEILKERLSIVKSKGRDASLDRENKLKERSALKRRYFQEALNYLKQGDLDKSFEIYKENISKFNKLKNLELAGLCLVFASLILIKQGKIKQLNNLFDEAKKEFSSLGKLIFESFPVQLTEYLIELEKLQDEKRLHEAISFIENLPLFEAEIAFLYEYLGKKYQGIEKEKISLTEGEQKRESLSQQKLIEIDQRFARINSELGDIRADKINLYNKRKAMKKRYYIEILELLESGDFNKTAQKYYELASTLSKRGDLETSSLLILLHGLTLLKTGGTFEIIRNNINKFLNNFGVNRKLVEDTFSIRLILFIIDVKLYKLDKYLLKIKEILEYLPLFEEERILTQIKVNS